MRRVVSNTSPLIFLAKIDLLDLISDYNVLVPEQVKHEIEKGKEEKEVKNIITYLEKSNNVNITACKIKKELPDSLGQGEKAAISCAVENNIETIWLDEAKARRTAKFYQLVPKGTIGILWSACSAGKLNSNTLEQKIFELVRKGYRIKEELLIKILEEIKSLK